MRLTDEEIEIFELAYLLRLPVYKIMVEMPYEELLGWIDYFKRRPVGWQEDRRTFLLMKAFGSNPSEELFPSIKMLQNEIDKKKININKNSLMFKLLQSSKGGDTIPE